MPRPWLDGAVFVESDGTEWLSEHRAPSLERGYPSTEFPNTVEESADGSLA